MNDKAVNFKTFKTVIWEMALILGYLFWKQLYLSGVLHWSISFGTGTNFSFYPSSTSAFSLKKGSHQSRLYWLYKYWMFVALSGHAPQLNLKVCLLFLQIITECSVFPSGLKEVSIINLTPLRKFWNSCFENSRGNYHQYNCLLLFFFLSHCLQSTLESQEVVARWVCSRICWSRQASRQNCFVCFLHHCQ